MASNKVLLVVANAKFSDKFQFCFKGGLKYKYLKYYLNDFNEKINVENLNKP